MGTVQVHNRIPAALTAYCQNIEPWLCLEEEIDGVGNRKQLKNSDEISVLSCAVDKTRLLYLVKEFGVPRFTLQFESLYGSFHHHSIFFGLLFNHLDTIVRSEWRDCSG